MIANPVWGFLAVAWEPVMKVGLEVGLAHAALPVGLASAAVPLLKAAVGVQDAEAKLLHDMGRDVKALLNGPWHTGDLYLKDASQDWRSEEERQNNVQRAKQSYMEAV